MMKIKTILMGLMVLVLISSFGDGKQTGEKGAFTGEKGEVKLITLDPGHFHAALVQKKMYDQVNPLVLVYSPEGPDVNEHLKKIDGYNSRKEGPTNWKEVVYRGSDYFEKMLA